MLRGLRCCMDFTSPQSCGGCAATPKALPPAEIVRICRRHPKDSGGKQFRSVAALFRAASTVVIAVDAIVRTRMGGGRARVSATIVPAKAFRRTAQARARDHGRPHDRWKAEGRDHDDPVILRGREHRAFSRENRNRFPASARVDRIWEMVSGSILNSFRHPRARVPRGQSICPAPRAAPVLPGQKLTRPAKVERRRRLQGRRNGQMRAASRKQSLGGNKIARTP